MDLQELFELLDTKGEGKLPLAVINEMVAKLDVDKDVDVEKLYQTAAQIQTESISFEQFIGAWENEGFSLKNEGNREAESKLMK